MEIELVRHRILQPGEMLNWYRILSVLGRGGFGVTYLAQDTNLQHKVAIKEYLPATIAGRSSDNQVWPLSDDDKDMFTWGLTRFLSEARTLARFNHRNIVRVLSVFEANNTAYMVMAFEEGCDFKLYLKRPGVNSESNLKTILAAIIDGLQKVHEQGFIHRDIKPSNIYIRNDGSPTLLDFGSARKALGSRTQALTSLVTVGYTPLEQYSDANPDSQGPWTDIYALGAVMYYSIMGQPPVDSTQRGSGVLNHGTDPFVRISDAAAGKYSASFLNAIDWALSFAVSDRPQNLEQWHDALFAEPVIAAPVDTVPAVDEVTQPPEEELWEMGGVSTDLQLRHARKARRLRKSWLPAAAIASSAIAFGWFAADYKSLHKSLQEFLPDLSGNAHTAVSDNINVEPVLQQLAEAVARTDLDAVQQVSTPSAPTMHLLKALFRNFQSMNVSVQSTEKSDTPTGVEAALIIHGMSRDNGVTAVPADSYRQLALQVERLDSGDVQVLW